MLRRVGPDDDHGVLISGLLDLVLPACCAGCTAPGAGLCPRCAALLAAPALPVSPAPRPVGLPRCHAVASYDGAVRAALIAYKERGRRELRRPLGKAIAAAVAAGLSTTDQGADAEAVLLVPVPSRAAVVRQRGTDTTRDLAIEAARLLRRPCRPAMVVPALRLCRATSDSAGLSAADRAVNVSGAMRADRRLLPGARVVIVDDLLTTGATLAEAARALAAAGRPDSAAAVVAITRRRGLGLAACAR